MGRKKTTVYVDADVLTATKVLAAARQGSESQVVEDALRAYLGTAEAQAAGEDLRALMERLAQSADRDETGLGDEAAMDLAVDEVAAVRAAGRAGSTR
ncbi:MAG: CopG family transcriptional regulator [Ornithinimicrobium sp.]|uniref:ribbon-helix-helix domain-containing protein n=1 Tax=Ornithinimicrobium sp. TaxID=1977084 RepID=UPI003D9B42ED